MHDDAMASALLEAMDTDQVKSHFSNHSKPDILCKDAGCVQPNACLARAKPPYIVTLVIAALNLQLRAASADKGWCYVAVESDILSDRT